MKHVLLSLCLLFIIPIGGFSQNITGPTSVCLNQDYDYRFTFDRSDIQGFRIDLIGGNRNGQTFFENGCIWQYGQQFCPQGQLFNLNDVTWTSTGIKRIIVKFYNGSAQVIASDTHDVQTQTHSFTPNLTGPFNISSSAWFQITGTYSSVSWNIVPSGSGINISPNGNNQVYISNVQNSPHSWHMIQFQGQYVDPCGVTSTKYASRSFYKSTGGGGGWRQASDDRKDVTFNVFPNPTTDLLNIQSKNNVKGYTYEVYTSQGLLKAQNVLFESTSVDVTVLRPGLYLLLIKDENGQVIVQHNFLKE